MAYGQTGAGKTFTITGATESYKERGLVPRALSQLFKEIEERPEFAITVRYNLQILELNLTQLYWWTASEQYDYSRVNPIRWWLDNSWEDIVRININWIFLLNFKEYAVAFFCLFLTENFLFKHLNVSIQKEQFLE